MGRWLLHHWGMDYAERPHAPIFHALALKWCGAGAFDDPLLVRGGANCPTVDQCPDNVRAVTRPLTDRPTGRFIQRIYDDFRKQG